jgi:hypothetical protein
MNVIRYFFMFICISFSAISFVAAFRYVSSYRSVVNNDNPILAIRDILCALFFIVLAILIRIW